MTTVMEKPDTGQFKLLSEDEHKKARGMTQAEYARHRNITRQMVHKYIEQGKVVLLTNGNIDVEESDKKLEDELDPSFTGNADEQRGVKKGQSVAEPEAENDITDEEKTTFQEAKAKEKRFQAGLVELKYLKSNKELVSAEEMEKTAYECARMLRDSLLRVPLKAITQLLSTFGIDASVENIKKGQELLAAEIKTAMKGIKW